MIHTTMTLSYSKIDNIHCVELDNKKFYSEELYDIFKLVKSTNKELLSSLLRMI